MTGTAGGLPGRVLHTGQGVVDVVMRIPAVPEPGGDVFAEKHELLAGGGVNVMMAAARDGAQVVYAGSHGTGPFGDLVRSALRSEGVLLLHRADPDRDTGFSIALVDDSTERTFVSTSGAESHTTAEQLHAADVQAEDIVYVSGYSLVHEANRTALLTWLPTIPDGCTVVVDPSPVIGDVDLDAVRALLGRSDVWSSNEREARLLLPRLTPTLELPSSATPADLAERLAGTTGRRIVLRAGARGAFLAVPGEDVLAIPAPQVDAVDTNGAGDAHTGVLCARLAAGEDLLPSVRRAGAAAALAVMRQGPATAPTATETDAALADLEGRTGRV
ncbi:PfkB family carbohydrate kinase [Brachybacterium sp. AOP43-C2-M15]|uniref:PfkB family carbohydrate kinase n=1 Tax=Brachybacterium sp. AOP43-C2-M15 TaxID=3457661 RepID=UPI0040333F96